MIRGRRATTTATVMFVLLWTATSAVTAPADAARIRGYSAKYICGLAKPPVVTATGTHEFTTTVEVHNPHHAPVEVALKVVQEEPTAGVVSGPTTSRLEPNGAFEVTCDKIPPIDLFRKGFVVVESDVELKVVALYKEFDRNSIRFWSVAVAKKTVLGNVPPGIPPGLPGVRHAAAFVCGETSRSEEQRVQHETSIAVANLVDREVPFQVTIADRTGVIQTSTWLLGPNGFQNFTCDDILGTAFREGSLTIRVNDNVLEVEQILQKSALTVNALTTSTMSVVEVEPVSLIPLKGR